MAIQNFYFFFCIDRCLFLFVFVCFVKLLFQMALTLASVILNFFLYTKCFSDAFLINFEGNDNPYLAERLQENEKC